MFMRSYKDDFGSPNIRCNSKNKNEEDGAFYVLDSLARSEMKRNNNNYNSYKEIQKDKTVYKKRTPKSFTNTKINLNNEHLQSSKTTTRLHKNCSQFKETDTKDCNIRNEFREIEHNADADIESQNQTQLGLESSLIFISKVKQKKMGTPEMKGEPNSSDSKLFESKENPNPNTDASISRQINDNKIKNFQNSLPKSSETCPKSDPSCGKYLNDDSYKFGCSETYIVIHGINRRNYSTISDCDKKIIKTMLREEIIPQKDQNTPVFDKKCLSVNTKDVIDHLSLQRKLSKHAIPSVEKSKECFNDEQSGNVSIRKANVSRKYLTSKGDVSTSEKELPKINYVNAKRSCKSDEARVTKIHEINCLKPCHRDYSNMTQYERTRELKRIYGKSLLNKSHPQRKVQNPEWVF